MYENISASRVPKARKRAKKLWVSILSRWQLYVLILPALLFFALFHYWPIYGLQIAFRNYVPSLGITESAWVGLDYFERFFNSYYCGLLLKNTIIINLYSLAVGFPIPIIIALGINEMGFLPYKKLVQTVLYAPHFISTVVFCGMIISFLSPTMGIVNKLQGLLLGLEPVNYMGKSQWFSTVYVLSGVWQNAGWDAIIYIAALAAVDPELHEAAVIDGASRWQRVKFINVPCILPAIMIMLILRMGSMMNIGFEKVYLLQNSLNLETSEVICTYVYRMGLQGAQYSFSSAVGLFNSVINLILLVLFNTLSKAVGHSGLF